MSTKSLNRIKTEILAALRHEEAEDGLYLNNILVVHEEEERPIVSGNEKEILQALQELAAAGRIVIEKSSTENIYRLLDA